jgi:MbtH protein
MPNRKDFAVSSGGRKMSEEKEGKQIYKVVVNEQGLYSIWPADRENAIGWNDVGKTGTKQECLSHIEELWPADRENN